MLTVRVTGYNSRSDNSGDDETSHLILGDVVTSNNPNSYRRMTSVDDFDNSANNLPNNFIDSNLNPITRINTGPSTSNIMNISRSEYHQYTYHHQPPPPPLPHSHHRHPLTLPPPPPPPLPPPHHQNVNELVNMGKNKHKRSFHLPRRRAKPVQSHSIPETFTTNTTGSPQSPPENLNYNQSYSFIRSSDPSFTFGAHLPYSASSCK